MSAERRNEFRLSCYEQVALRLDGPPVKLLCDLVNLSENGCCVSAREAAELPEVVEIAFPRRGEVRRARVIWRRDFEYGLHFLK